MKKNRFAVIGIGQFGRAIASTLASNGAEVMVVDNNQDVINSISEDVSYSVVLDATDPKALISQNITDFEAVVISIGNFESRLLCASILIDLGVKRIIVRSIGKNQKKILEKIGITDILSPEDEVGALVAERLTNPNVLSFLKLPDGYRIAEVCVPKNVAYKSIEEINLQDRYQLMLVTIKNVIEIKKRNQITEEQHILAAPDQQTVILPTDSLVLFGLARNIEKFVKTNQ